MKNLRFHKPYEALKREFLNRGLTYRDVANVIGVAASTVQLKINGQSDFYISEILAICEAFGIDAEVFFAEYEAPACQNGVADEAPGMVV